MMGKKKNTTVEYGAGLVHASDYDAGFGIGGE